MNRRRLLLALLALPVTDIALAQESAAPIAPAAPAPAGPPRRRPRPRPRPEDQAYEPIRPLPQQGEVFAAPRADAAPVPNRDLEGPRPEIRREQPQLAPTVMVRRLPGRGLAADGSYHAREERLFAPGPGARLSVPFSY